MDMGPEFCPCEDKASLLDRLRLQLWYSVAVPGWRNWQTRRTQNPVGATPCRFDSYARHQISVRLPPYTPAFLKTREYLRNPHSTRLFGESALQGSAPK